MPPEQKPQENNTEPILESILMNQTKIGDEHSSRLDMLLEQNDRNNPEPILEAQLMATADGSKKVSEAIKDLKPEVQRVSNAAQFIEGFLTSIKGDKGDKGETGDKGEKGEDGKDADEEKIVKTVAKLLIPAIPEIDEIVAEVMPKIRVPKDGKAGADGKDGESVSIDEVIARVTSSLPKIKNGKNGKDGSPDTPEDIVNKINTLDGVINITSIKDAYKLISGQTRASRTVSLTELDDVDYSGLTFTNGKYVLGSGSGSGGSGSSYTHTQASGATTWSVAHNLNDSNPLIEVYSPDDTVVEPQSITIDDANNLTITFGTAVSGIAKIAGGVGSGGSGAVDSVNGQTGVVVLDADDIDDTSTTNKFVTAGDITKLGNLSGTNTGDVSVTGEDYLSLAGQAVTANPIDLDNLSATGTPSSSTFLRGDNTWSVPSGSGDVSKVGTPVNNQVGVWTGDGTIEGDAAFTFVPTANAAGNLTLSSNDDGGEHTTDSTSRLVLNSYQRAEDTGNYGEVARIYSDHARSKQMFAWYKRFNTGATTFTDSGDVWNATDNYLEDSDRVVLSTTGTLPTGYSVGTTTNEGVTTGTVYYVVSAATNTFQLSATKGGAAVVGTGTGSGTITYTIVPQLKAWCGWHYLPNDVSDTLSPHDHWSVETNDADGLIRTRFEVVAANADTTQVNTFNSNFTVIQGTNGVSGLDGQSKSFAIYTAGDNRDKTLRWAMQGNATSESGSNVGTDYQISRFADNGNFIDAPFLLKRSTGYLNLGSTATPSHSLTVASAGNGISIHNQTDQLTNYERMTLSKGTNIFTMYTENGGSGTQRNMRWGDSTEYLEVVPGASSGSSKFNLSRTTASSASVLNISHAGMNLSSGSQYGLQVSGTVSQSGTAGYNAILVNMTESSTGSGLKRLLNLQTGGTSQMFVTNDGTINSTSLTASRALVSDASKNVISSSVTSTELDYVSGVTSAIQTQLDAKLATATAASTYQPLDSDLTTIAGLTATTDNFIQSKAGAWASRTIAQVKTDLGLTGTNSGDVTVSDSSEIDLTLTGQEISASIVAGSIDEAKLDTSVNASLDLADSALQAANISDTAYDATSWNTVTTIAPSKNAVRDKIVDMDTAIALNTAKVTNATHTGEVTGATTLTVDKTAVTGKTAVTAVGTDYVLISDTSDSGNLKKALVSDIMGSGSVAWGAITGTLSSQTDLQTALDAKSPIASPIFTGTVTTPALNVSGATASTIAIFDGSKNLVSAATATYPSLTEFSYVKGVTSAIQTQMDTKLSSAAAASTYQPLDSDLTTIAGLTATTDNFIVSVSSAWASRTPAQVRATLQIPEVITVAVSDETTALTTGTGKFTFRMPYAMTLTAVRASVTTAPTGSTIIVDINEGGTTIMSTDKLSIDASEKTSTTAATAAAITDSSLADDAEITIDIDQVGSTVAGAGLKVTLIGYRT